MTTHNHIFHFLKNIELGELYASFAIRSFAVAMISVFVPVYLIKLGYSISNVLIFFIIAYFLFILAVIPCAKLASRFGFKHLMIASVPMQMTYLILLYTLPKYGWPLFILSIFYGLTECLYWTGLNLDFAVNSDKDGRSEEVGLIRLIASSFRAVGPLTGGLLITFFGFKLMFIIACIIIILSGIPLFITKDIHIPYNFNILYVFKKFQLFDSIAHVGRGLERAMYCEIWPLIIFLTIASSYTILGSITTVALLVSLLFTFIISKLAAKNEMLVFRFGAILNTLFWIGRTFLKTNIQVFITDSLYGFSKNMYLISFDMNDFNKASSGSTKNLIAQIIKRELLINFGYLLLFVILLLLGNIQYGLYVAAVASLMLLFMKKA